ncbi:MAG: BatA domain-containing protein [Planctomycetota bacterium]
MSFTYPALAIAGAALALLPIVIHLLNRRRRRVVPWAAMDFLLESDRKNRTWVRLTEWLLLAARVLAIGLVGILAAKPQAAGLLDGFFGGDRARHVVLLDDTCSLGRRGADGTAWEEAIAAIDRLTRLARRENDDVVVLRYADVLLGREIAVIATPDGDDVASPSAWQVTNTSESADDAFDRVVQLCDATTNAATTYVYVLSDFAVTTHGTGCGFGGQLERLAPKTDGLVLAACGDSDAGNLAIERVTLVPGPVAAGVETRLRVEVVNHSDEPVAETTVTLTRDRQPLTTLPIGPFDANERLVFESPVSFPGVGIHTVEAALPTDRLPADDRAWMAVETPAAQPVLLIDDSEQGVESRVFAAALRPKGTTRSGWSPQQIETLAPDALGDAAAVLVLDIERLPAGTVAALRDYVRGGGGVLLVLGPRVDAEWFNRAFAEGLSEAEAFVPWRLGPPTSVPPVDPGQPMFEVVDHPVTRVLAGDQNGFLPLVRASVQRRLDADPPRVTTVSLSDKPSYAKLIERFDGEPLLLESRYGEGRLLALLTTAATGSEGSGPWSNLATLPIFPVLANDIAAWLSHERLKPASETIGTVVQSDQARSTLLRWSEAGEPVADGGLGSTASLMPSKPGVYRRVIGGVEGTPFAARIDPAESDLRAPTVAELTERWAGIASVGRVAELFRDEPQPASRTPLYAAALLLAALLAAERWLAYHTSYVGAATPGRSR